MIDAAAARGFVLAQGRVLEQRLYACLFEDGPAGGVLDALRAFRNADGGFGHGLEPDKRCPASQPLDVQLALETLDEAGAFDRGIALAACDWLATVADAAGRLPPVLPTIAGYPSAAHWGDGRKDPDLNVTCGVVAVLARHVVEHPWRERAESTCWEELEREPPGEAHTLRNAIRFVDSAPDRGRGAALRPRLAEALRSAAYFRADADARGYGLTPLAFPTDLFTREQLAPHLDRLERDQQPDGGWPVTWQPPSEASLLEWRAIETLRALRTLRDHGRIQLS